jgi:hypothetical protein
VMTTKIALAHLAENADYYERLEAVEAGGFIISRTTMRNIVLIMCVIIIIVELFIIVRMRDSRKVEGLCPYMDAKRSS